jgi:mannitol/fructose-specific phosphotransferase system IIA component (Ntr-type)
MKLSDIIVGEAVVPQLKAKARDEVIGELVTALADAGAVTKQKIPDVTKAILKREAQATTGIGKGIALPHVKMKGIRKPVATIGCSAEGIDFASLDGKPVYSVILLLSNPDDPDEHLQAMETIFKHVQRDMFRKFLRQSETRDAVMDVIQEADEMG